MTHPLTRLNPPTLPNAAELGYSQITTVEPGRLAFISGQVARRPDGQPTPDSLVEQTKIVAANARAALDAVGAAPTDVIMARIYMVDLTPERQEEMIPHLLAVFEGAQPSVTGIGVAALAAPDLQIEMELIVRLPD
ncbi:RidA family protein [Pontivivens ytuae]|uniref:RidA family protein n=1 Tax=Pontivivens ytuae TaxID=2789856 RepID=A0A7S9LUX4_9RHOB|nr:RidA family protein [Pontivivens ytuae]QPH55786.1 RidA family protein [Pontivivens ytuae]